MGCHSASNIAPFSLTTCGDARTVADLIASATRARTMPPRGVRNTEEYTTNLGWKGDIHLSDQEIDALEAWSEAGAPEGDPGDAPPAFVPQSRDLPRMTHEIHPSNPYVTSGDKDEFRCFVIDPGLTEDTYLNGLQVVPGNPKVVHHPVISVDPERSSEKLAGPDGSFECGATLGSIPGGMINAWAPGSDPLDLPERVGSLIPEGSLILMQIHYHPAGATADPDTTRVQLRLDKEKPKYGFSYQLLGNFEQPVNEFGSGLLPDPDDTKGVELLIAADSPHHAETQQVAVPAAGSPLAPYFPTFPGMRIHGEFLHMHYLGFDQKVTITRPNAPPGKPMEECLMHAPGWAARLTFSTQCSETAQARAIKARAALYFAGPLYSTD